MKRARFLVASGSLAPLATRAIAVFAAQPVQPSSPVASDRSFDVAGGTTAFPTFASAPFPHASRAGGHDYGGKHYDAATHYADSTVGVFIPNGLRADVPVDLVVHFHGWNNDVRTVFTRYRLREQLVASGRSAVLLVPEVAKDAPDSAGGKLELDPDGFRRFVDEAPAWLVAGGYGAKRDVGRIVLSAHSGGYAAAGGVLTRGGLDSSITDVLLFDAAYGYFDAFAAWANGSPARHLLSVFTDDTSVGNATLMALVDAPVPNVNVLLADSMTLERLQTRRPTFAVTTSVAHDDLLQLHDWYALFLRTTALGERTRA